MTSRGFEIPSDIPLIVKVFCLVAYYDLIVRFVPIRRILDAMGDRPEGFTGAGRKDTSQAALLDKAWRAANFFLGRFLKQRDFCLPRTLALYRWCRSAAIEAGMVIGVKKDGGAIRGHAWLLVAGEPYRENRDEISQYAPMLNL